MKRFLFILITLSCLFACKKQEQEVLPPEDPDTPEENEEVPPTPYDADDVDLLLRTYAVNVAVGMWDDYWNSGSNYFLYLAPGKNDDYKVWLIPYDYDNTLGTSHNYCAQTDSGRQDPWKWGMESAPLMTKILKNAEWAALYKKYLQDLCAEGGDFHYKTAMARIRAWQSTVAPFVSNDTQEDMAIEDKPGWWGNHHEYRIMEEGENNFFQVKAEAVGKM